MSCSNRTKAKGLWGILKRTESHYIVSTGVTKKNYITSLSQHMQQKEKSYKRGPP